jgi:molybdopterin-guanine dinucleotide biosynthesis protein MobB
MGRGAVLKVYGVTGWKNSGKTGLMERLVAEFTRRGLRVATVKHAHHRADIDQAGTDSHRHRVAGAGQVLLATPERWALMTELHGAPEPCVEDLLAWLDPHDIALIEGYKAGSHPKVECHRAGVKQSKGLIAHDNSTVRLIAADEPVETAKVPVLDLDDTAAIADFIWADLR